MGDAEEMAERHRIYLGNKSHAVYRRRAWQAFSMAWPVMKSNIDDKYLNRIGWACLMESMSPESAL